ncbi:DNA recombination protein RmuC [Leucobacter luti]|uniref:DNA recombination protein RmuC n=1 Tax=Leucobacter luti TaxID=340320 RepID=A0A4Q7U7N2_9MICO|nr:DNA recombination protein RmuC [Leucobacter luti]MBL3700614.1 DNA recombination protein RmuC [Leucobacter luti]RZT68548.1 DNA recombination protein RmuC [Leucobacter luti]
MTPITLALLLTLVALIAAGVGAAVGVAVRGRAATRELAAAAAEYAADTERDVALATQRAKLDAEAGARILREELAAAETRVLGLEERLRDAHHHARERSDLDREEQRVLQQLAPLRDSLGKLEHTVAAMEQQRAAQHGELSQQLRQAALAEDKLRGTAEGLAAALRSNNTRGFWGETQLRRIIEAAGMIEHVDFELQEQLATDRGTLRPDVVIHLPGGKAIAIDAKVPFDAYLEAQHLAATAGGSGEHAAAAEARRTALLAQHARALREHIVALSKRDYAGALPDSPEFVIAFLPSESLLSSALDTDPVLLEYAFERRVALASPVSLWAILKSVAHSWRQDSLTAEARTLFDLSRELHSRIGRSATHLDKLGRTLSRGVQDYNAYVGSFERHVLPTARKISALNGEQIGPDPAQLDVAVRPLIAPELRPEPEERPGAAASPVAAAPATAPPASASVPAEAPVPADTAVPAEAPSAHTASAAAGPAPSSAAAAARPSSTGSAAAVRSGSERAARPVPDAPAPAASAGAPPSASASVPASASASASTPATSDAADASAASAEVRAGAALPASVWPAEPGTAPEA